MINNVVLVLGIEQSDSVMHVSVLSQIHFPGSLLQNIEQSSLCYSVGHSWLSFYFYYYFFVCFIFGCTGCSLLHIGFL